jgi:molybdopterin-guanine dinucleotide biosynthesis protein A
MHAPFANSPFSAVLLAGGKSSRMGFDKAAIPIAGVPLWIRQISLLQEIAPAQLFISGPALGPWAGSGFRVIEDIEPGSGPLGGIASVLPHITTQRLLVLGIDLPKMPVSFLEELLSLGAAAPFREGSAVWEPLAAVYPVAPLSAALQHRSAHDLSLQPIIRGLVDGGHLAMRKLSAGEEIWFASFNTPEDALRVRAGHAES